jgi:RNA polymerase sigma-70 factor (ECF subfamily)
VAWLWSIVRSELARHFRQHRPFDTLEETHPDPASAPPEVAARNELQARIRDALALLNEEQQRIIYLKYYMDVPNTEIAGELGLSPSNVGVIVHRAIGRLRELMEQTPSNPADPNRNEDKSDTGSSNPGGASPESARGAGFSGRFWLLFLTL